MVETEPEWFEDAILKALRPGRFIGPHRAVLRLIRKLEGIQAKIRRILKKGDSEEAVRLFWFFLVKASEKAPELAGSAGAFALFFESLFCDWVRARQAAGADPGETAGVYMAWSEKDGFGHFMDLHKQLARVLDPPGFQAFEGAVREKIASMDPGEKRKGLGYDRAHWVEVLKCFLAGRGDARGFLSFCRGEGGMEVGDFDTLAEILERRGKPVKALAWVEKGLLLSERKGGWGKGGLEERKKSLLKLLGWNGAVLALEWKAFRENPSLFGFEKLLEAAPREKRRWWRERALAVAEKGDVFSALRLFLGARDWDRLARVVERAKGRDLEDLDRPLARRAANALARRHPEQAARLFFVLALGRVEAGRTQGYPIALRDFQRSRDCYLAAGRERKWQALAEGVRRRFRAKWRFMEGFEKMAGGGG